MPSVGPVTVPGNHLLSALSPQDYKTMTRPPGAFESAAGMAAGAVCATPLRCLPPALTWYGRFDASRQ